MSAEFATKLKEWRGELTQREAALLLGVSLRTLQCWEQDQHVPGELARSEIERRMKETKKGSPICPNCGGKGMRPKGHLDEDGQVRDTYCGRCNGTGRVE